MKKTTNDGKDEGMMMGTKEGCQGLLGNIIKRTEDTKDRQEGQWGHQKGCWNFFNFLKI